MGSSLLLCIFVIVFASGVLGSKSNYYSFDQNYEITWGNDHVLYLSQGREIQLSMDKSSGSGFGSKLSYGSGFFHMRIRLPGKDSAGIVTAFYLTSHGNDHDELDFEFLGNREGKPDTLQTNIYTNGKGDREQRILLWFDPSADFHTYRILWNPYQIVFFVDDIPIRVFKNKTNIGVDYPRHPMQIVASLWDGEDWATDGGQTKTNWTQAPFRANFKGFNITGCPSDNDNTQHCYSTKLWWNRENYWSLNPTQEGQYQNVRENYMNYDYCSDRPRYPIPPPECPQ